MVSSELRGFLITEHTKHSSSDSSSSRFLFVEADLVPAAITVWLMAFLAGDEDAELEGSLVSVFIDD